MAVLAGLLCLAGCCWMTIYAALYWKSFWWSLLFCFMQFCTFFWLDAQFNPYCHKSGAASGAGMIFTFLGVFMLLLPEYELGLFRIFFNIGIINQIGSILNSFLEKTIDQRLHQVLSREPVTVFTAIRAYLWECIIPCIHIFFARTKEWAGPFIVGAGCTFAGIWLRNMAAFGLTPFVVGNLCIIFSTITLRGIFAEPFCMFDFNREDSWMVISFVLTQLTMFLWDSFVLASLFCLLFIMTTTWHCLYYVPTARNLVMRSLSNYLSERETANR